MDASGDLHEDWFLQHLVILANRHNITFPVTLQVSGFIVTGHLIGGTEYFESIARSIEGAMQDKSRHWVDFAKSFAKFGAPYSEPPDEEDGTPAPGPRYVHLKGAKVFADANAGSLMNPGGVLWRGRVDAVSGFVLGIAPTTQRPEAK